MDAIDSKALAALMKNARTSWAVLGEELGLSAPAAAERVHKMEEAGTIRGYTAIVEPEAVGYPLTAFVAVSLASNAQRAKFLAGIERIPEILECHHVTGDDDYLLKVRCKGTVDLDRLLNEDLKTSLGVGRSRTTIVLRTSKETSNLPIALPVKQRR
jgi:Lrp/AsnC family transcriptional regulator, leucine-responsive regulatory protein